MSTRQRALIVDDEPDIRELLEITLGRMKLDTRSARNVKEAREWLAREPFDLCLTDMRLPDGTGLDLVQHIQQRHAEVPVAMITAYGSLDTAINALKAGAFDFLTKPVDLGRLRELVGREQDLSIALGSDWVADTTHLNEAICRTDQRMYSDKVEFYNRRGKKHESRHDLNAFRRMAAQSDV